MKILLLITFITYIFASYSHANLKICFESLLVYRQAVL